MSDKKKMTQQQRDSVNIRQGGLNRANMVSGRTADKIDNTTYNNAFEQAAKSGEYKNYRGQTTNINPYQDQGSKAGAKYYNEIGFKNKDVNFLDRAASGIRLGVAKFLGRGGRF